MKVMHLVAAAGVTAAALVTAAPAYANPADDAFIDTVTSHGITFPSTEYAIDTAHQVCDRIDSGQSPASVATEISGNSGLGVDDTGFFVGAAIGVYCPWNQNKI